jgi:hypothetical protein
MSLTSNQYSTFTSLLSTSKSLITSLEKADYLDRFLLLFALIFFVLVCIYVIKRRILDKGFHVANKLTEVIIGTGTKLKLSGEGKEAYDYDYDEPIYQRAVTSLTTSLVESVAAVVVTTMTTAAVTLARSARMGARTVEPKVKLERIQRSGNRAKPGDHGRRVPEIPKFEPVVVVTSIKHEEKEEEIQYSVPVYVPVEEQKPVVEEEVVQVKTHVPEIEVVEEPEFNATAAPASNDASNDIEIDDSNRMEFDLPLAHLLPVVAFINDTLSVSPPTPAPASAIEEFTEIEEIPSSSSVVVDAAAEIYPVANADDPVEEKEEVVVVVRSAEPEQVAVDILIDIQPVSTPAAPITTPASVVTPFDIEEAVSAVSPVVIEAVVPMMTPVDIEESVPAMTPIAVVEEAEMEMTVINEEEEGEMGFETPIHLLEIPLEVETLLLSSDIEPLPTTAPVIASEEEADSTTAAIESSETTAVAGMIEPILEQVGSVGVDQDVVAVVVGVQE